jgi:hypothetical protein
VAFLIPSFTPRLGNHLKQRKQQRQQRQQQEEQREKEEPALAFQGEAYWRALITAYQTGDCLETLQVGL